MLPSKRWLCLAAAPAILACVTSASPAQADSRARIVTRQGVVVPTHARSYNLGVTPTGAQFPQFQGPVTPSSFDSGATNARVLPQVAVIQRRVVEPDATVSQALHEQPVHPHLIEVFILGEGQLATSTIYLHPDVNYERQGRLVLDENHSINRAQRLGRSLRAGGATVIWGPAARDTAPERTIKPHMIFMKPDAELPFDPPRKELNTPQVVRAN